MLATHSQIRQQDALSWGVSRAALREEDYVELLGTPSAARHFVGATGVAPACEDEDSYESNSAPYVL